MSFPGSGATGESRAVALTDGRLTTSALDPSPFCGRTRDDMVVGQHSVREDGLHGRLCTWRSCKDRRSDARHKNMSFRGRGATEESRAVALKNGRLAAAALDPSPFCGRTRDDMVCGDHAPSAGNAAVLSHRRSGTGVLPARRLPEGLAQSIAKWSPLNG